MTAMLNGKNSFFDFDMTKAFAAFQIPGFDIETVMASQRKNLEALTQANQLAVEGVQAVARRHAEITRQVVDEASALLRDFAQPVGPEERIARQAEFAKSTFEKTLANARELTDLAAKANSEAFAVINKRVAEGLDEIRDLAKKRVAR
jgi:phasin family protein